MTRDIGPDKAIFETMQSLRRIFKAIQDYSHEVSSEFGVTGPQLWALKTISREGSLPLGELSKKMYLNIYKKTQQIKTSVTLKKVTLR